MDEKQGGEVIADAVTILGGDGYYWSPETGMLTIGVQTWPATSARYEDMGDKVIVSISTFPSFELAGKQADAWRAWWSKIMSV